MTLINELKINFWGRYFLIKVVYDCYGDEEITLEQKKAILRFSQNLNWIDKAKNFVELFCEEDLINDDENHKKNNIFSYIKPEAIFVKRDFENPRIAIMCKYRYDAEHGLAIVFDYEGNVTVGIQDIII